MGIVFWFRHFPTKIIKRLVKNHCIIAIYVCNNKELYYTVSSLKIKIKNGKHKLDGCFNIMSDISDYLRIFCIFGMS